MQVLWCAAKSSLYLICRSENSACNFSYSDMEGQLSFCWMNLRREACVSHVWSHKRECEVNKWTYSTAEEGLSFCSYKATRTSPTPNWEQRKQQDSLINSAITSKTQRGICEWEKNLWWEHPQLHLFPDIF